MVFMPGVLHQNYKHGARKKNDTSGTYVTWMAMRWRCAPGNAEENPRYAGKGVKVCRQWEESFENFLKDMGERPKGKTIDRIDHDGNYTKENCRWATPKQQARNRGNSIMVMFFGRNVFAVDIANEYSIPITTLRRRINQGYKDESLVEPSNKNKDRVGTRCPSSKLTEDQVIAIKKMLLGGMSQRAIADMFKVRQPTISDIKNMKTWVHISNYQEESP